MLPIWFILIYWSPYKAHLTHCDGNWSYRSYIMADAEAAEQSELFQTVVF